MFASLRNKLKWGSTKPLENKKNTTSIILAAFIGILEDVLFWKKNWLSLSFICLLNVILFMCIYQEINVIELFFYFSIAVVIIDAFEAWLKHKHRTTCLKRLAEHDGGKLKTSAIQMKFWVGKKWTEFIYLRETNHTKAFLLVNIYLGMVFIIGKYISGYILLYILCMMVCFFHKLASPIVRLMKKIQLNAESDVEYEGLIPEVSDLDINLLSIDPEPTPVVDERLSLDYWKPVDVPIEEASDSSDNSSSLVTNLSIDKMRTLDKDVETSDSSEDDEYIPLEQKEQLQSTLEVIHPSDTWSSSAYNAFWNLSGAVANMMYTKTDDNKRKRVSSIDSSDGFEMIDKNDLM